MSAAVGTFSALGNGLEIEELKKNKQKKKKKNINNIKVSNTKIDEEEEHHVCRDQEEIDENEDEEDDSILESLKELDLGPQDDDSLRRWKEQLLGSVDISAVGESKEPEVKIISLSILCPGRPEIVLPIPLPTTSKSNSLFTLKEGSQYHLKLSFTVSNNIVSGLKYTNTVWKTGVRVDKTKVMLGTFSPKQEPYTYELEEETTPSGIFARGSYSARTKVVDDDGKCYLDVNYCFEIQKKWPSGS
ncbi:Rho GDP-dissociation inhibitor, putative [Ricinus communis]|uniref:Rho GDP-dissociation inhibitor, putative n=1 Tax=Ricinus communis TaxID=3988 RepID=B9RXZ4_RICCO|nr:Rho GDP-dissociation inhibitor, putative [Ricinus communis]